LKVRGEHLYRLGPLAVPERTETGAQALTHGAVALFVERAQAVDPRFAISDGNAHLAVELCRVLEGLPLAIELAAARAHLHGLPRLLASMNNRLMLLTGGRDRLAPARQRTLRAALEWSHGLLAPREQRVFRRLAVVSGSASLDLLQSLLIDPAGCDESLDAWGVLDALDELVDRSLVVVVPQGDGAPRYRLLDSPRALALELLEAAGERPALQERHARLVAAHFETAYHSYFAGRGGAVAWLHELEPDLDNARQALASARALHDVGVELTLGATLLRAMSTAAHSERMALADACAASLETTAAEALPRALRLRVWTELSSVWVNAQKQQSKLAADRAVELARSGDGSDDDRFALCRALARAATSAAQSQELARASAYLEEALSLQDPQWPASRRLWCAEAASWVAHMRGDAAESLRRSRELYELERARGGNVFGALSNLVDDELAAGDAHAAVLSGQALVEALTATRREDSMAFARINLAAALLAVGDTPQARTVLRGGWDRAVAFELDHCAACYLALLAALEGRPRSAARLHRFAETEYLRRQEAREGNESRALDRAKALTVGALGATGWAVWQQDGDALRVDGVAAIAFATLDG
ncbi:MAG TPA: hypothetical protein VFU71_04160, partial [Burkholderiaceae bacterium]|nr:hypothetical protein [Burkholderiaceae bacterium]